MGRIRARFAARAKSVKEIPRDFKPRPLGISRIELISKIKEIVPNADFTDLSWGKIKGDDFAIEVNLGDEEIANDFAFHVHGGVSAALVIAGILRYLNLRAVHSGGDDILGPDKAVEGMRKWQRYRDYVLGRGNPT